MRGAIIKDLPVVIAGMSIWEKSGETVTQAEKAQLFLKLHLQDELLVLPNPWDVASARIFEKAGFPALATTSAGMAATMGYADNQRISKKEMLSAIARIARGIDVPVTADIEGGYSSTPEGTADSVLEFLATGIVGINLEDRDATEDGVLFDTELQCDRIRAVREMTDAKGIHLVINARTDIFLEAIGDSSTRFARTIGRAHAFKEAGADCIFIPGAFDESTVGELVKETVAPVNILIGPTVLSLDTLQNLGVARVSSGSGPARAALGFTRKLAEQMRNDRSYQYMIDNAIPYAEVNALFED